MAKGLPVLVRIPVVLGGGLVIAIVAMSLVGLAFPPAPPEPTSASSANEAAVQAGGVVALASATLSTRLPTPSAIRSVSPPATVSQSVQDAVRRTINLTNAAASESYLNLTSGPLECCVRGPYLTSLRDDIATYRSLGVYSVQALRSMEFVADVTIASDGRMRQRTTEYWINDIYSISTGQFVRRISAAVISQTYLLEVEDGRYWIVNSVDKETQ